MPNILRLLSTIFSVEIHTRACTFILSNNTNPANPSQHLLWRAAFHCLPRGPPSAAGDWREIGTGAAGKLIENGCGRGLSLVETRELTSTARATVNGPSSAATREPTPTTATGASGPSSAVSRGPTQIYTVETDFASSPSQERQPGNRTHL